MTQENRPVEVFTVVGYVPLLLTRWMQQGGVPMYSTVRDKEDIERFQEMASEAYRESQESGVGLVRAILWVGGDRIAPVFIMDRAKEIHDDLKLFSEGKPEKFFTLNYATGPQGYTVLLVPNIEQSTKRVKYNAREMGFAVGKDPKVHVLFSFIRFWAPKAQTLQRAIEEGKAPEGVSDVGFLDINDFNGDIQAVDQNKILFINGIPVGGAFGNDLAQKYLEDDSNHGDKPLIPAPPTPTTPPPQPEMPSGKTLLPAPVAVQIWSPIFQSLDEPHKVSIGNAIVAVGKLQKQNANADEVEHKIRAWLKAEGPNVPRKSRDRLLKEIEESVVMTWMSVKSVVDAGGMDDSSVEQFFTDYYRRLFTGVYITLKDMNKTPVTIPDEVKKQAQKLLDQFGVNIEDLLTRK